MQIRRLLRQDVKLARRTFVMMGQVFDEGGWPPLSDGYLLGLLRQPHLWVYAALVDGQPVAGLTAYELPMTKAETAELLVYDLAVRVDWQRRGVGRALIGQLLEAGAAAGVTEAWVPADNDDPHALEFYRRTGGSAQPVTIFTYLTGRT